MRQPALIMAFAGAALTAQPAAAERCQAEAGPGRAALVELYTSEGCSSCPPADRWLSGLQAAGLGPGRVVALAFHVDYWDYIGWPDRYASPAYSQRQREAAARQRSRVVFTPQVLLNGRSFHGWSSGDLGAMLGQGTQRAAGSTLRLALQRLDARRWQVVASGAATASAAAGADLYLVLYEDNLASEVARGENAGRRLVHNLVVRALVGPLPLAGDGSFAHSREIALPVDAKAADVGFAAFVQARRDGDVLQAVSLAACRD